MWRFTNRWLIGGLLLILVAGVGWWWRNQGASARDLLPDNRVQITASFYPLYYFASRIGGDRVLVYNLTPAGAEPHDYEPTTADIARIERSDILLVNGGGLEHWLDKVQSIVRQKSVMVVTMVDTLNGSTLSLSEDPHVWLDPDLAKQQVEVIKKILINLDPEGTADYVQRADQLVEELTTLDGEFVDGLARCRLRIVVTSHQAMGYVAGRYQLKQLAIAGLSPDEEPAPREIARIAELAKAQQIKYIFFETLVSPRLAETVAREIGANTLVYNPVEGLTKEEELHGSDYFSIQRENLRNLRIALDCQ